MKIKILPHQFSVCQLKTVEQIDFSQKYFFLSITDEEISLVCETASLPQDVIKVEHNWAALKIVGALDFSLVGILSNISSILAQNNISIFAISTYNTDYILIKSNALQNAVHSLKEKGYEFV